MEQPTPEFAHLVGGIDHDLREAVTLSKGWLELALKNWATLDEQERHTMVLASLYGANRVAFLLDMIRTEGESDVLPPAHRMAEDLLRISNDDA